MNDELKQAIKNLKDRIEFAEQMRMGNDPYAARLATHRVEVAGAIVVLLAEKEEVLSCADEWAPCDADTDNGPCGLLNQHKGPHHAHRPAKVSQ